MTDRIAYNIWANQRVIDSLRSLETPPPLAVKILAHLAAGSEMWLSRVTGSVAPESVWPEWSLDEAVRRLQSADARFAEMVDDPRMIAFTTTTGVAFENSVAQILEHVLNHATYHRGEIAGIYLAEGLEPVGTDYILFLRR